LPWDERAELDQLPENRKKRKKRHLLLGMRGRSSTNCQKTGKKRHLLLGMRGRSSTNCQKTGKKEKKDTCCLG